MRNCITEPAYQLKDLGVPLPDSEHAASVAMPLWQHVTAYEEGEAKVINRLICGYPRFLIHPKVAELNAKYREQYCSRSECCLPFPSLKVAERAAAFVRNHGVSARVVETENYGISVVCADLAGESILKEYWQHSGEIVSSRLAAAVLSRRPLELAEDAKQKIRKRVAEPLGIAAEDVLLFPSGMAAMSAVHRALQQFRPGPSVQFGFPYIDSYKLLGKFGPGVILYPEASDEEITQLESSNALQGLSGIYTEIPGNPLLKTPNLKRLAGARDAIGVPLVIDDTIGTSINTDVLGNADIVFTSLTKFFSGAGDVMGGAVVVNPKSAFCKALEELLRNDYEDLLCGEDAQQLETNSSDYAARVQQSSAAAEKLCDFLVSREEVASIYYPKYVCPDQYEAVRRTDGGYGALFSILLKQPADKAPRFFDALRVNKGPSLGTNFTLACPYTLLAHYNELEWAEECGVSRYLIRVSVGLEEAEELIERFAEALDHLRK